MIFAPRSCPSRPGFAITTRILLRHRRGSIWSVKLTVVGCSPGLAEPGRRAVRLPARGPGAGSCSTAARACSPKLREREAAGRRSTRSRSRTGTSTTGATSCPGSGARCSASARSIEHAGALGAARTGASSSARFGGRLGQPDDVRGRVRACTSTPTASRSTAAGLRGHRPPRPALPAARVRLPRLGERDASSATPATPARATGSPRSRATPTSSSARRRCSRRTRRRAARPPRGRGGGRRLRGRRARSGCCSRTGRTSGRSTSDFELAHDGLEIEI